MSPRHVGNWGLAWASWLGLAALAGAVLWAASGFRPSPADRPELRSEAPAEQPLGQQSGEDYHSQVWALAFAPSGAYMASATVAGEVWVKNLQSARSFRLDRAAMGSARSLAISPDGAVLAVAGKDAFVRMWDIKKGQMLDSLEITGDLAKTVAFAPEGRLLAVGERRRRAMASSLFGTGAIGVFAAPCVVIPAVSTPCLSRPTARSWPRATRRASSSSGRCPAAVSWQAGPRAGREIPSVP